MAAVRLARAFRLPIIATAIALALPGCMQTAGPVAVTQPSSDLDYMAYGRPDGAVPAATDSSGGGAISALRNSFASASPRSSASAPVPAAYAAAAPAPVIRDAAYRLDAGDKLRDVVTLTHTDASGPSRAVVPLGTSLGPGDTVLVGERWF